MDNRISQKFSFLSLVTFSMPAILMLVLTSLYTAVDGIFVARFVNSDALSAINIVLPFDSVVCGIAIMLGAGGSAVIGRKLGEGKPIKAREDFTLITLTAIVLGVVFTVLVTVFLRPLLVFLGASERLFPYCEAYGRVIYLFAIPYILQVMFNSLFITAGKPRLALIVTVISGLMNLALDYVFIVLFDMGIAGAAWGTTISRMFGGFFPLLYFGLNIAPPRRQRSPSALYFCKPRLDFVMLGQALSNGSSEMVSNIAAGITTFLFNITVIKLLGEDGVAAITIVLYTQFLYTAVFFGFVNSAAPVISFHYGRGDRQYLQKLFRYCLCFIGIVTVLMLALCVLFATPLIALFTPQGSSVFALAYHGYFLFLSSLLFTGVNIFASSLFTALSNGLISALISFLRTFVFIVASVLVLPLFLGVDGLWLAVPLAELLTVVIAAWLLVRYGKVYHYLA